MRCKRCRDGLQGKKECECCGGFYHDCVNCSLESSVIKGIWDMYHEQEAAKKKKQNGKNDAKDK